MGLSVALRDCLPSVRVKPSSRLTHMEGICWQAGRPRRQPIAAHFTSCFAGNDSCLGTSASPVVREARTLLGAGAGVGLSLPVKQHCVISSKSEALSRSQLLGLAEVLAELEFGVEPGVATMEAENNEVLNSSGSKEETLGCSAFCGRDASALESSRQRTGKGAREDLMTLAALHDGAPAHSRHISRQGRVPVPVSCRARYPHHEASVGDCRAHLVLHRATQPWRPGPSDKTACRTLYACICRGAHQESRLDPVALCGDKSAVAPHCFLRCLTEHPSQIQNLSTLQQRNGHTEKTLPR